MCGKTLFYILAHCQTLFSPLFLIELMTIANDPTPFLPDVSTQGGYLLESGALAVATAIPPQQPLSSLPQPSQLPVTAAAEEDDTAESQDKQVPTPPPEQSQANQQQQQHSPSVEKKRKCKAHSFFDIMVKQEEKKHLNACRISCFIRWSGIS